MVKGLFRFNMNRFSDSLDSVSGAVDKLSFRAFGKLGFAIMRFTRDKVLKPARQKKVAELSETERADYDAWKKRFKDKRTSVKPMRPDIVAKKGDPPLLHSPGPGRTRRQSPLRKRLFYDVDKRNRSLLAGPEVTNSKGHNVPQKLERGNHPFVAVGLEEKLPTLQQLLKG